jgi:nucleoside-diphosphate-sugar epimerase
MNIAIFGGSGRVGQALIPALIERGHSVRAMQHRTRLPAGAQAVEGSITDPAAVTRVIENADVVLQMTMGGEGIRQAVETSVQGTIIILDAVRSQPTIRQYLLTSSDAATGIWAHPQPEPISHKTPPSSYPGYYSLGKVLEEMIVREYHRNYGVAHTIARLSWVQQEDSILRQFVAGYDPKRPNRGPFDSDYGPALKRRLQAGQRFVVLPCDADGTPLRRTLVQREDVTAALLAMVGDPRALNETFHVSGRVFAYDEPCRYLAGKFNLPIEEVRLAAHSFEIDCSHTTQRLGWEPKFDVIGMIDAALAWRAE